MTPKERLAALEALSRAFLNRYPHWQRVKSPTGRDRYGPHHRVQVADDLWLVASISLHPSLDDASFRIGWSTTGDAPQQAQDATLRGEGTLDRVRLVTSPREFDYKEFSIPMGKLISRFMKVYRVEAGNLERVSIEALKDFEKYAIPYFLLLLRSRGVENEGDILGLIGSGSAA